MRTDILVIGGGASGLMAAITAKRAGSKVIVLEQKDRIGRKILATGNGKCNYTNLNQNKECYRGNNSDFAWDAISYFTMDDTILFFRELGIAEKNKNGYIYPYSEQASAILDVLRFEIKRLAIPVYCDSYIKDIHKEKDLFIVTASEQKITKEYKAMKVILATGGKASPQFGSDGSGYILAKKLGHNIIKPMPALVGLKSDAKYFKELKGVRVEVLLTLIINGKILLSEQGELQLTDYGISGIVVFQLSRYAIRAKDYGKEVIVSINFLPKYNKESLTAFLKERFEDSEKTMSESLIGLFNKKLGEVLLKESKIDLNQPASKILQDKIDRLTDKILNFPVAIYGSNSFDNAQVTAGGIDTTEIKRESMESEIIKGLYFAGEIIDVDGACGGYNLQWAWTSGYIAGSKAAERTL